MKLLTFFFVLIWQIASVVSDDWNPATDCLDGITTDITSFVFSDVDPGNYYATMCNGTLSTTSLWAAAKLYCSPHEIEVGEILVAGWCVEYGATTLVPYSQVEPILTDEFIESLPVVKYEDIAAAQVWNTSVLISKSLYMAGFKTSRVWNMEYQSHHRFGWAVFGFWGGVIVIGMINRVVGLFLTPRRVGHLPDQESNGQHLNRKPSSAVHRIISSANRWTRANLIIPTTFGTHHRQPLLLCTIPTRIETLVIFLFWIVNIAICCAYYELFSPNLYYTKSFQGWRYVSDRTGIICFYNLPWLWIFAGRNNIFISLTGWSFQTFNVFHRHIARVAVLQAIIHSIGYSVLEAGFNELASSWKENYWYMGGISIITMSLLLVVSSMFFRQRSYEVFLLLHIVLSVLTLVGLFYHVAIFDGEYNPYLWPLVAIWLFDRTVRLLRWAHCNLSVKFWNTSVASTAIAFYDVDADLIRLSVVPGSNTLKLGAGQHYFLYHFRQLLGWENHPFTLATYGDNTTVPENTVNAVHAETDTQTKPGLPFNKEISPRDISSKGISSSEVSSQLDDSKPSPNPSLPLSPSKSLTFLIRPYTGWTARLKRQCLNSTTNPNTITFNICIEGPYGHHSPLHTFENLLFIVGGTGISGALPYLQEYFRTLESAPSKTVTRNIKLVWAAKQRAMLRSVAERELESIITGSERGDVEVQLHCTSERSLVPKDLDDTTIPSPSSPTSYVSSPRYALLPGRPDVTSTILAFVETVHNYESPGGRCAVLTCGPASMADEARAAVHTVLKRSERSVEYFEETFGW